MASRCLVSSIPQPLLRRMSGAFILWTRSAEDPNEICVGNRSTRVMCVLPILGVSGALLCMLDKRCCAITIGIVLRLRAGLLAVNIFATEYKELKDVMCAHFRIIIQILI